MNYREREHVKRRLAAILAADVVGYSRLMGQDEEGTLAALKALRHETVDPRIKEHRGRIVKTMGDGLLVEFASVVDAVRCAVDVQREIIARNDGVPAERRIEFRIGINVGDIIIDDRDIYGDGVNVAARLEALAEPGGICISRVVRDQVRDKLDFTIEDRGEQNVKNIARPVRVFRILLAEHAVAAARAADAIEPELHLSETVQAGSHAAENLDAADSDAPIRRRYRFRASAMAIFVAAIGGIVFLSGKLLPPAGEGSHFMPVSTATDDRGKIDSRPSSATATPLPQTATAASRAARSPTIGDPVLFEKDKIVLSRSAGPAIDRQAEFLKDNPEITVTIDGYSSEDEGVREGRAALAQLRANQVRDALKERGVASSRMQAKGHGTTVPAIAGTGEMGTAQLRQVVVLRN